MATFNRKRIKPPRGCIFCKNNANSKEHFWSEWMHRHFEKPSDAKYNSPFITYSPIRGENISNSKDRPGHVSTLKIRRVCTRCNNGWMNLIEGKARPFLEPAMQGMPVILSPENAIAVAQWVAMKCMVLEHARDNNDVTPRVDIVALKETGAIPPFYRIYVASHTAEAKIGSIRYASRISFSAVGPEPPLDGTAKNVQTISFLMGSLFVHVNAARVSRFDLESRVVFANLYAKSRVWPSAEGISICPENAINPETITRVSQTLDTVQSMFPRQIWLDDVPGKTGS